MKTATLRRRGFTLVEVLISTVIMSIVTTAVAAVFIAVQNNYEQMSRTKTVIEGSRSGIAFLERTVALAGYGIDPRFAFDFTAPKDNTAVATIDGVAIVTDDLGYRWRDPNWIRRGGFTGGNLTLDTGQTFGVNFRNGQRFMVMCNGAVDWIVVEAGTGPAATANTQGGFSQVNNPFPTATPNCLSVTTGTNAAWVAILHEVRVRIRNVNNRPFLVAYQGITTSTGASIDLSAANTTYDPIAVDVEDFQVAYEMNRPGDMTAGAGVFRSACCAAQAAIDATGNSNYIIPDSASEALPSTAATAPRYDTIYDHTDRYNSHPANIRQVRISMIVRSSNRDANRPTKSTPVATLENSSRSAPPADGFFRIPMTTNIRVPNMWGRTGFTPDLTTNASTPEGNFNGG